MLLARWLCTEPKLLILDEPTRGIDVGAKRDIQVLVRQLADEGLAVLLISSELEEIIADSDRVVTLRDGRSVAELTGDQITEDALMQAMATGDGRRLRLSTAGAAMTPDPVGGPGSPSRTTGGRRRSAATGDGRGRTRGAVQWRWAQRYGALAALVALFVYNAIDTPFFLTRSRCCSSCCGRRRRSPSSRSAWPS